MTTALVDPELLEEIRRNGVLLRRGAGAATEFCYIYRCWRFFFKLTGNQAPEDGADGNGDGLPDYVERMLCRLEVGYRLLSGLFDLPPPLHDDLRYVDVQLDDIPLLHGVAMGRVRETEHAILAGTPYRGPALGVRLHRGLIDQTATPQHEVFHLFQYCAVPFINSWFMEGLATWYHRIYKNYPAREQALPATLDQLADLVVRKHDAEAFWSRLFRLCDRQDAEIPEPYCHWVDIRQGEFHGRRFLRHLLAFLAPRHAEATQEAQASGGKIDIRNLPHNNLLIFRGLLSAIDALAPDPCEELTNFVELLRGCCETDLALYRTPAVQGLMGALRDAGTDFTVHDRAGVLYSPCFDPLTGTLTIETLHLRSEPPEAFAAIRRLQGNLSVAGPDARILAGFEALESVSGTLTIANNSYLEALTGLSALKEVGALLIERNPALTSLTGLSSLRTVRRDLRLTQCAKLAEVTGLGELATIGGDLELSTLPSLAGIGFLGKLTSAANVVIKTCAIDSAEPLRLLLDRNPDFKGSIRITGTRLTEVDFLSPLRSVGSSLYLSENRLERIGGLARLETVDASFTLAGNRLTDLTPLRTLRSVAGILSVSNNALTSLDGLENLRELRTKKWGDTPSTLRIYGNPNLRDISALANVETDDHYLILHLDESQRLERKPPAASPFHRNTLHIQDFRTNAVIPAYRFAVKPAVDRRRLRHALRNHALDCVLDLEGDADTLVVMFSGKSNRSCWSVVEALDCHRVVLADTRGIWYHGGVPGLSKNLDGTVAFLERLAAARPYRRVLCLGAGSGGYMAMLVGWRIKADRVIAFAPHTTLEAATLHGWQDGRFDRELDRLPASINPRHRDLNRLFAAQPNDRTALSLSYSAGSPLDRAHVTRLDCPNITDAGPSDIYDRLLAEGHAAAEAINAEAFLAVGSLFGDAFESIDNTVRPAPATRTALPREIAAWLGDQPGAGGLGIHLAPEKLRVPAVNAFLSPDLFVTADAHQSGARRYVEDAVLAIEIAEDSVMAFDKGRRFPLFAALPSLQEYVLLDVQRRRARVLRRDTGVWTECEGAAAEGLRLDSIAILIPAEVAFGRPT